MKNIKPKLNNKQSPARRTFFDLPADEQKQIMMEAAKGANEMQQDLLKRYEEKFGSEKV